MASIGEKVRSARLAAGLTQAALASGLFDRSYLSLIENDKLCPPIETLRLIASRLDRPLSYFVASDQQEASVRFVRAVLSAMEGQSGPRTIEALFEAVRVADLTDDQGLALEVRSRLIAALMAAGRDEEAFRLLSEAKALALADSHAQREVLTHLTILEGNALFRAGRFSEAVLAYRVALGWIDGQVNETAVRVSFNLGTALYREGNFIEALHHYRRGLALARKVPTEPPERFAGFHHGMGICLRAMGQFNDAYAHTKEACDLYAAVGSPKLYEAKQNLGVLAMEVGRMEEAEGLLDDCLRHYVADHRTDLAASCQEERTRLFLATARRKMAHEAWKDGIEQASAGPHPREFARLLDLGLRSGFATQSLLRRCERVLAAAVSGGGADTPLLLRAPRPLDLTGSGA